MACVRAVKATGSPVSAFRLTVGAGAASAVQAGVDIATRMNMNGSVQMTVVSCSIGMRALVAPAAMFSGAVCGSGYTRSEEHTSELQSLRHLVCRLLLEK